MKTVQHIVTSSNTPLVIPLSARGGIVGIGATPSGAGNYTVQITLTPLNEGLTPNFFPVPTMTAETGVVQVNVSPVTAIRVTLNSGTNVTIDLAQSDV